MPWIQLHADVSCLATPHVFALLRWRLAVHIAAKKLRNGIKPVLNFALSDSEEMELYGERET